MNSEKIKNISLITTGFALSAAALTVIQPPVSISGLAWVALVPFILVCSPKVKPSHLFLTGYLVSFCYWLGNLYWLIPVTISGWVAFCMYTALLWPMLAVCLRFCRIKKIPLVLAVPVLVVGAERLQGLFLGGFFWRFLAHSQYANITLIQIADIFGAAGVSFIVAMVNGLFAELILAARGKTLFRAANLLKITIVCLVLLAAILYGRWRINQSEKFIRTGPAVAAVQSNVPQSVKESFGVSGAIFEQLLQDSKAAAEAGAELIVWPETMVQATLDEPILRLLNPVSDNRVFDTALKEHAADNACLLVGAYGGTPKVREDWTIELTQRYNSAFLYKTDGTKSIKRYDKIHLVPFGEFVPFKKSIPWLYSFLMKFTPYDYDYSLDAGNEYTIFEIPADEGTYKFSVMICYEDAIPVIARRFALNANDQKQVDWLVNISNDGWFVRAENGDVIPGSELSQHAAVCVFRAVENRLSVLRSVNTGISCLIDPLGRLRDGFQSGDLPVRVMDRTGCAGFFVDRVPIDARVTFFSKYGQWLDFCCTACFVLFIIVPMFQRLIRRKTG